jgi:metal-sulfur cluster biosynthetic enzyme
MLSEDLVRSSLKNVIDPEIGLNIVDLGLIYGVDIRDDGRQVVVNMTLTTPACPAGPQIIEQAHKEVKSLNSIHPQLDEVNINLVWTPFWNPEMMTQEAKDELGFF